MTNDTLTRFREGLKAKRLTLTMVSEKTGIPIQRLAEMADDDWGKGYFKTSKRLALLERALQDIGEAA